MTSNTSKTMNRVQLCRWQIYLKNVCFVISSMQQDMLSICSDQQMLSQRFSNLKVQGHCVQLCSMKIGYEGVVHIL